MWKKKKKKKREKRYITQRYNRERLHEERRYGFFWYAILWTVLRPVLVFACSALIVMGLLTTVGSALYERTLGPVDPYDAEVVPFTVESGSSVSDIGARLESAGLMRMGSVLKYVVQLRGNSNDVAYGTYALSRNMSALQIVEQLTGQGSNAKERTITIVPGWTCEDIAEYLVQIGAIDRREDFLALCNDVDRFAGASYALTAAQKSGALTGRRYALEGYLAPDTYRIFTTADAESIIGTLLRQHNTLIDSVYYGTGSTYTLTDAGDYTETAPYGSRMSMDEIIILASMLEKEAANEADYARVAAVLYNRLERGWKLESDPTAAYLTGSNRLILSDAELNDANPYNTYAVTGLPVGPICNPSPAALRAAMNPDPDYMEQEYLYFCTAEPGTGTLAFARTLEEHAANVAMYRPLWAAYDAGAR